MAIIGQLLAGKALSSAAAAIPQIIGMLKGAGIIKDPEQELKAKLALEEMAARQDAAWVEYVKATTPQLTLPAADRVAVWANTFIAILYGLANVFISLVRPGMAVYVGVMTVGHWQQVREILGALAASGIWGAIWLAPLWVWVLGRDITRTLIGTVVSWRTGKVPLEALPPGIPAPAAKDALPALPGPRLPAFGGTEFDAEERPPRPYDRN